MSTTIDQQVVEMRFDNRQFENNLATTVSSLDKLKQSLNLSGASKGLEDVGTAAKKIDLSGLGNAADAVAVKFSYLQMTIQHRINQMVDSVCNAGERMIKALTIDPVRNSDQCCPDYSRQYREQGHDFGSGQFRTGYVEYICRQDDLQLY